MFSTWAYGNFKDLARRTASDKVLRDKAFNITKNHKYNAHQRVLASIVYKLLDKKSEGSGVPTIAKKSAFNNEIKQNRKLAEELHKPCHLLVTTNTLTSVNINAFQITSST